jgi:hypothetical protein
MLADIIQRRSEATHMRLIDEHVAALEAAAQPCEFTS